MKKKIVVVVFCFHSRSRKECKHNPMASHLNGHLNSQKMANLKTLKINQICYKYFNIIKMFAMIILSRNTHEIAVHNDRS